MPHPPASHRRRPRQGITLVEMAVVLVIMGLLAAMVIPRIGRGIAQRQLDRAADQAVVDLRSASQLAGRHRRPVRFRLSGVGYEIIDHATPTTVYIKRRLNSASGISASSVSLSPTAIVFYPNGLTSASGTLTIAASGRTRVISVSSVGHVRRQ